jgi:DNA-binding transcriptional LysR family regulator
MGNTVAFSSTIDLNDVAVFVRVIDAGSFSRAASDLGLTKSAVSRRVARLEEALGVRLMHRTTRRSSLTEAGKRFHQRATSAVSTLREAASEIDELVQEPRGTVRITAPPDLGTDYLVGIVGKLTRRHPGIEIELSLSTRLVDIVAEGFDIALRGTGALRDSSLVARRIAMTPLVLIASSKYLAARGTPRAPEDLSEHECILFGTDPERTRWKLTGPAGERTVAVHGAVRTDDLAFSRALAGAGGGIALSPLMHVQKALARGTLVRVLPQWRGSTGALYLVCPPARHVPHAVQLVRDYLLSELTRSMAKS